LHLSLASEEHFPLPRGTDGVFFQALPPLEGVTDHHKRAPVVLFSPFPRFFLRVFLFCFSLRSALPVSTFLILPTACNYLSTPLAPLPPLKPPSFRSGSLSAGPSVVDTRFPHSNRCVLVLRTLLGDCSTSFFAPPVDP